MFASTLAPPVVFHHQPLYQLYSIDILLSYLTELLRPTESKSYLHITEYIPKIMHASRVFLYWVLIPYLQLTWFTNPRMHLFHSKLLDSEQKCEHFILNGELWNREQVHSGIYETNLLHWERSYMYDGPTITEARLKNMGKHIMWIH